MSGSREESFSDDDSISSKNTETKSLFGRLVNYFKNRTQNKIDEPSNASNLSKKPLDGRIKSGKVHKPSNISKTTFYTKRLTEVVKNLNDIETDKKQSKYLIRPPVLHSSELERLSSEKVDNSDNHYGGENTRQETHETRKETKPRVIRLGQRRAIRINPSSSTSSISLSQAENSSPISKPKSPSTSSPSPQPESFSNSKSNVPSIYDILHSSEISPPSPHIDASNASTPYKSRSRIIKVNTIDELDDEPLTSKAKVIDNFVKSTQNLISDKSSLQELVVNKDQKNSYNERKKKKKKSKDGRKSRQHSQTSNNHKYDLLKSHNSEDQEKLSDSVVNTDLKTVNIALNNKLHNPFYFDEKASYGIEVNNEIGKTSISLKHSLEETRDTSEIISPQLQLKRPNLQKIHNITNEDSSISYTTHKDSVGLKWPGYNSIEEIIIADAPGTIKSKVASNENNSNKSRPLSEIMTERYKKDGILFQGEFKTNHLASVKNQMSDESTSDSESNLPESPVIRKFGVDIRKERTLRQGKIID